MSVDSDEQQWKNPSIYRVPAFIAKLNCKAYLPQVVSFGPFHHGEDHLHHVEEHKRRTLQHIQNRTGKKPELFLESLQDVAQHLQESYDALDPKWKNGAGEPFLELMIMDGCFMLEVMRIAVGEVKNDYAPNDPIFSPYRLAYITPYIKRDMLKLENQLPMLVLELLVKVQTNGEKGKDYILNLILKFHSIPVEADDVSKMGRSLHVLDVFRKGKLTPKVKCESNADGDEIIRSATELNEAGIQFKRSLIPSLQVISFGCGALRLPVITVNDTTETMFLNLMTFERLHIGAGTEVTSYVIFMDNIINNERDVALLHGKGIIQNALGSDKAVADLFNSLCKEVTLESNNSLDAVQREIREYCKKPWNRWRANLNHTYFSNPWTILSLIAAIFLFALTIIQTVYAVRSYY